jgi:hypothetical protein
MNNQVACKKCLQLEKHGIKRQNIYYDENKMFCVQCLREKAVSKKKQKILNENLLKTLDNIKKTYGGSKK